MSDNRTTELREKLDECGIYYEAKDRPTNLQTYWGDWAYCEPLDAKPGTLGAQCELILIPATPEQAIAATLGSDAKPCYATDCTHEHCKYSVNRGWVENAELGSGTCRIEERLGDWYCDMCGNMVSPCDPESELFISGNAIELWNYCPNCGRKVEQ